jgi:hypothetical protein
LRRLRRDHPELHNLVLAGEISPFSAAVAAGFRKRPGKQPKCPVAPLELELSADQMQELWLGPSHHGSVFADADELREAWSKHKDRVMELWGQNLHRPAAWWELELCEDHPGYDREPAVLFERGLLSEPERQEYLRQQKKRAPPRAGPSVHLNAHKGRPIHRAAAHAAQERDVLK